MGVTMISIYVAILAFGFGVSMPTHAQDRFPKPKPLATIAAIDGRVVTLRSYDGRTATVLVRSATGLMVGQHTSWCEEDCRVVNIWMPFPVEQVKPLR